MLLMETLCKIGPLVPGLLMLGGVLSLLEQSSLMLWAIGVLSLSFATVVFGIQLIELTPTWFFSGMILLLSAVFLAWADAWALSVEGELLVIHPSGIPLIFSIIWFLFAAAMAFRILKQRAFSA